MHAIISWSSVGVFCLSDIVNPPVTYQSSMSYIGTHRVSAESLEELA